MPDMITHGRLTELETTISYSPFDSLVRIWTNDPKEQRKLKQFKVLPVRASKDGNSYIIPLDRFQWGIKTK